MLPSERGGMMSRVDWVHLNAAAKEWLKLTRLGFLFLAISVATTFQVQPVEASPIRWSKKVSQLMDNRIKGQTTVSRAGSGAGQEKTPFAQFGNYLYWIDVYADAPARLHRLNVYSGKRRTIEVDFRRPASSEATGEYRDFQLEVDSKSAYLDGDWCLSEFDNSHHLDCGEQVDLNVTFSKRTGKVFSQHDQNWQG